MELVSVACSSQQRGRGAEEIINIGNLSRNCIQAAFDWWKSPRLPGGEEKDKQANVQRKGIYNSFVNNKAFSLYSAGFTYFNPSLTEYFIASENSIHATRSLF